MSDKHPFHYSYPTRHLIPSDLTGKNWHMVDSAGHRIKSKCEVCNQLFYDEDIELCDECNRSLCKNHRIYFRDDCIYVCWGNQGCKDAKKAKDRE